MFPKIDLRGIKKACPFMHQGSVCCAGYYNKHNCLSSDGQYLCQCDWHKLVV